MLDITNADFLAAIDNSSIAACFNSASTLPSSITPVQIVSSVLEAYKTVQSEVNEANTGTQFINTIVSVRDEPILFDDAGIPFVDTVSTVRIKKTFVPLVAKPYIGGLQII